MYYYFKFKNKYTQKIDAKYVKFKNINDINSYIQTLTKDNILIECCNAHCINE